MKKIKFACVFIAIAIFFAVSAMAHTPILICAEDNGNCECKGFFSDMSSAAGAKIIVKDDSGKVIWKGKINEDGECIFSIPKVHYTVTMDAGPGHETEPWDPKDEE